MTPDSRGLVTVIVTLPTDDANYAVSWVDRIYAAVPGWDTTPGTRMCVSYERAQTPQKETATNAGG